jgi:hypothetical protein
MIDLLLPNPNRAPQFFDFLQHAFFLKGVVERRQ